MPSMPPPALGGCTILTLLYSNQLLAVLEKCMAMVEVSRIRNLDKHSRLLAVRMHSCDGFARLCSDLALFHAGVLGRKMDRAFFFRSHSLEILGGRVSI